MATSVYNTRSWRELPRDYCAVEFLFGPAVGSCRGLIGRHHVDPDDPDSRTVQTCAKHHPRLHAALRHLMDSPSWKRCPHKPGVHRYPGAREECERLLNRRLTSAA
jgi:hypothetical protein